MRATEREVVPTQQARGVLSTRKPCHARHRKRKHRQVAVTCTNRTDDTAPRAELSRVAHQMRAVSPVVGARAGGNITLPGASDHLERTGAERRVGADEVSSHAECGLHAIWGTAAPPTSPCTQTVLHLRYCCLFLPITMLADV